MRLNGSQHQEVCMERSAYKIRPLLHELEKEMDLTKLSSLERDVLDVLNSTAEKKQMISSQDLLKHELTQAASRPTVYRGLKTLLESNSIVQASFADRGFFQLAST
jgi:Fe2+ or Zn2+ uptake regulation protein